MDLPAAAVAVVYCATRLALTVGHRCIHTAPPRQPLIRHTRYVPSQVFVQSNVT